MTAEPIEPEDDGDFRVITVTWDDDRGCPLYNIGDMDPHAAVTMLYQVADSLFDQLAGPIDWNHLDEYDNEEAEPE